MPPHSESALRRAQPSTLGRDLAQAPPKTCRVESAFERGAWARRVPLPAPGGSALSPAWGEGEEGAGGANRDELVTLGTSIHRDMCDHRRNVTLRPSVTSRRAQPCPFPVLSKLCL